jgi:hypothetical protein
MLYESFPSSVVLLISFFHIYSFHCRDLWFSLLSLPSGILIFEAIVNGIVFLHFFSLCSLLVYRKVIAFCKLLLSVNWFLSCYFAECLWCLIVWCSFPCFLNMRLHHLQRDSLSLHFLFEIIVPVSLLWLVIPGLCWIRVERVDTLISFLTL